MTRSRTAGSCTPGTRPGSSGSPERKKAPLALVDGWGLFVSNGYQLSDYLHLK